MTYPETVEWMFAQLPMYQRQGNTAFKKDLTNIKALLQELRQPQDNFKAIHIAGTNGKGSVSNMMASVFYEAGYKTGLYTSPHLKDYRERIKINGNLVSKEFVIDFIKENKAFLEQHQLSFFEMSVGMAFQYFSQEKVDIAIIETGLGGRLDSTNVINPELSIITNIAMDHTQMLGNTLQEIAGEKAGIIKAGVPVVIGEKKESTAAVFEKKAAEVGAPLFYAEETKFPKYESDLRGIYQKQNIQTFLKAAEVLTDLGWIFQPQHLEKGLKNVKVNTGFQGRWDRLGNNPNIIADTGHNKAALEKVFQQLELEPFRSLHIVLGVVNDKDLNSILALFPENAHYYFSSPNVPRGLEATKLMEKAAEFNLYGKAFPSIKSALEAAKQRADRNDLIFIGGSTFTVAEII